ncbi:MAG: hypothetical protein LKF96_01145 [Treponema sp.]|nr:hypothetical protein [Treponema sp.]
MLNSFYEETDDKKETMADGAAFLRGGYMKLKHLAAVLLTLAGGICTASADSLVVMVEQAAGNQKKIKESTILFEQAILDYFYDNGCIVSDAPLYVVSGMDQISAVEKKSYLEARDGYFDYFIIIRLNLEQTGTDNPDASLLENIKSAEWKVIEIMTDTITATGTEKTGTVLKNGTDDEGIRRYAGFVAEQINKQFLSQSE